MTNQTEQDNNKSNKETATQTSQNTLAVNRTYKARIFEMLYNDKTELLDLYNAVNGTNYKDPEQLEINTLKNAIYMAMHNDISFVIDMQLSLYEHQSTFSPNLPLRYLFYMSDLYSAITRNDNLYGEKVIHIPTPKFIIFYNGEEERLEREVLKLSAMYQIEDEHPSLELEAILLNINPGYNEPLKKVCKSLSDYTEYTSRVRKYAKEMPIEEAVERAITECIEEGILAEFLKKNRAEAKHMSIYEYDAEKHIRMERADARADGIAEGLAQGRIEGAEQILVNLVKKKLTKNESVENIADDLEQDIFTIQQIISKLEKENNN